MSDLYPTIAATIGNTPLVELKRLPSETAQARGNIILGKLEGNNPAGSVKDRPAFNMIRRAMERGDIRPGDTLIEATSGNTGIALAMAAAMMGFKMLLVMPENQSLERRWAMTAYDALQGYGAELVLTDASGKMELARDRAEQLAKEGRGYLLDQFSNPDNPSSHFETTGPEIWRDTHGKITHFVSAMGTTGTITGVSQYLKSVNPDVSIIGVQPEAGSTIAGIRKWEPAYLPRIYSGAKVDSLEYVSQADAEEMARRLAREEGIFCGVSAGGAVCVALRLAERLNNATIVTIICDRGDRYLSTGVFQAQPPPKLASVSGANATVVTAVAAVDVSTSTSPSLSSSPSTLTDPAASLSPSSSSSD